MGGISEGGGERGSAKISALFEPPAAIRSTLPTPPLTRSKESEWHDGGTGRQAGRGEGMMGQRGQAFQEAEILSQVPAQLIVAKKNVKVGLIYLNVQWTGCQFYTGKYKSSVAPQTFEQSNSWKCFPPAIS